MLEDEAPAYRRLHNLLQQHLPEVEVLEVLDSVADGMDWLNNNPTPDLIFSDIQLSDGLSLSLFQEVDPGCPVVFTTAHDAYVLEAFAAHGIDYLLKPIEAERLIAAVEKFKRLKTQLGRPDGQVLQHLLQSMGQPEGGFRKRMLVKIGARLLPISLDEVAYFRSVEGSTEMQLFNGKSYPLDDALDALEVGIDPQRFFRLNRRILAAYPAIEQLQMHFNARLKVILKPDCPEEVYVSRDKARALKNWLS